MRDALPGAAARGDPGRDRRAVRDGPGPVDTTLVGAARRADGDGSRGGVDLSAHRGALATAARLRGGGRDGGAPCRPRHVRVPEPRRPARRRPLPWRDAVHAIRQRRQDARRRPDPRDRVVCTAPPGRRLARGARAGGADRRVDHRSRHGRVARLWHRAGRAAVDPCVLGVGADQPAADVCQRGGAVPRVPAARGRGGDGRSRLRGVGRGGGQRARLRPGPPGGGWRYVVLATLAGSGCALAYSAKRTGRGVDPHPLRGERHALPAVHVSCAGSGRAGFGKPRRQLAAPRSYGRRGVLNTAPRRRSRPAPSRRRSTRANGPADRRRSRPRSTARARHRPRSRSAG